MPPFPEGDWTKLLDHKAVEAINSHFKELFGEKENPSKKLDKWTDLAWTVRCSMSHSPVLSGQLFRAVFIDRYFLCQT